ncbi:MAG: T9SS type A sorting domain-containing protein [Chitinophagales bacterium]|nr:T9SS type A sorting domain-containing protein [Chitinophagales bacterium]
MNKMLPWLILPLLVIVSCTHKQQIQIPVEHKKSGAAKAMEEWAMARSYPDGRIQMGKLYKAFEAQQDAFNSRNNTAEWDALGPKNIGGRTLCVAFHPTNSNIQYIGSASGGLWKTTTAGVGVDAWERVPIGYPVLGVSSIAINPYDPDEMYIGTGEVYNYTIAQPGVANRLTRGSYGMGLLKTTDGGQSWEKTIDWSYSDMKGVWDIIINPENTNTVLVTTTEGIYRTYNAGQDWELVHDFPMGVDLEMHPNDTSIVYASHGNLLSPQAGIFRSENGGSSFEPVQGLPNDYTGKSLISISQSNPDVIYISMAEALEGRALYKSIDAGDSWQIINDANIPSYQGWFAHDVAIKPDDPDNVIWAGIETYKSTNGGADFFKKSFWSAWYFGDVPVGGPEGPGHYAHADIHAIYYAPFDPNTIYMATDGGIFVSVDNGESWEGRNGGYQTQQFYARFSSSATDPNLAIGGLQDNATAIYRGDDSWVRVIGGDGMCTAIHPTNPDIIYASYQNLNVRRSTDGGEAFFSVNITSANSQQRNFNGPFMISPHDANVIYAGAQSLHRSLDGGDSWSSTSSSYVDTQNGNPILNIAVSEANPLKILVATSTLLGGSPGVFFSENGGQNWTKMQGLPDRVAMEMAFHPTSADTAYVVFSGFNTQHLYRTSNGGANWEAIGEGLPDVPANTIIIDPVVPTDIYVGTDLGIYASFDGGQNFELYSEDIAAAVMAMHLSISPVNRKLRIATHGLGVYETDLRDPIMVNVDEQENNLLRLRVYPNPASAYTDIAYELPQAARVQLVLKDVRGKVMKNINIQGVTGKNQERLALDNLPSGHYYLTMTGKGLSDGHTFQQTVQVVKN